MSKRREPVGMHSSELEHAMEGMDPMSEPSTVAERVHRALAPIRAAAEQLNRKPTRDYNWYPTDRADLRCDGMDGSLKCHLIVNHPGTHHG